MVSRAFGSEEDVGIIYCDNITVIRKRVSRGFWQIGAVVALVGIVAVLSPVWVDGSDAWGYDDSGPNAALAHTTEDAQGLQAGAVAEAQGDNIAVETLADEEPCDKTENEDAAAENESGADSEGTAEDGPNDYPETTEAEKPAEDVAAEIIKDIEIIIIIEIGEGCDDPCHPDHPHGRYRVVFDGNGATEGEMEDQWFVYGEPQELSPNAFKKSGYRFLFWVDSRWDWLADLVDIIEDALSPQSLLGIYLDGEVVLDLAPEPDEPFVLHAVWKELTHVNINYQVSNHSGGALDRASERINPESGVAEGCTIELSEGYRLVSWTDEEGRVVSTDTVFIPQKEEGLYRETTYTANVEPIVYNISYKLDGGALPSENPQTYTVEDSFVLNRPTRQGYTFQGWTGTDLDRPTKSVAVRRGSTGDREYTAVWSEGQPLFPGGFSFGGLGSLGGLRGLAKTGDGVSLPALGAIVLLAAILLGLSRTARKRAQGTHFLDN